MVSVAGVGDVVGVSAKKVAADLESEEVPGRGPDCEEPRGARRLGVFGGKGATVVATPVDSGVDDRPAQLCIFFKLSSSELLLGAGRVAGEAAVPAVGRVNVREG